MPIPGQRRHHYPNTQNAPKNNSRRDSCLVTAAAGCHHFVVLFQNDVLFVVEVQQTDRVQLVWYAARQMDVLVNSHRVDNALDRGMVGRPVVLAQWEGTLTPAVVGVVSLRRDDPSGPADLGEVDVERVSLASLVFSPRRLVIVRRAACPRSAPLASSLASPRLTFRRPSRTHSRLTASGVHQPRLSALRQQALVFRWRHVRLELVVRERVSVIRSVFFV